MVAEKKGKALENLVSSLEKALSERPNIIVHSPMRLPDRTTGRLREHDVVLELNEGHHSVLIAIECRDRSRPIGVPQVEGFDAKCQHTGISKGVMVSTSGFCKTARKKADHLGIRCCDIEEVDNFNWLLAPGIYKTIMNLLSVDWTFYPVKDSVVERKEVEVIDLDGNVLTNAAWTAIAKKILTQYSPEVSEPVEEDELKVRFPGKGFLLRSKNSVVTVPVKYAIAKIRYSVKQELVPFRLVKYQANDGEENITDAAYADIIIGDKEARMMIAYKEGEGGKVVLIPKADNNV